MSQDFNHPKEEMDINKSEDEIFKSVDADMIQRSLKGTHVKVHVNNLISPSNDHCIRFLNEDHVNELVDSFVKNFQPYTTLVGLIKDNFTTADLEKPGKKCVEVLGGNHTRAALQKILNSSETIHKEKYEFVYMDVYQNLTTDQTLFLAFKHNELHEQSKELTFVEKVCFFHKLLLDCEKNFAGQPQKTISTKWRSEIAAIMNKTKIELKNSYKVHLNLAASKNEIWVLIKDVFTSFENGSIKGQKRSEHCSQYCFWHFSKVKTSTGKISLLTMLKNGNLTPEEFRSACQRSERENDREITTEQKSPIKHTKLTSKKRKSDAVLTENETGKCKQSKKKTCDQEIQVDTNSPEKEQEMKELSEKLKEAERNIEQMNNILMEKNKYIGALKKKLITVINKAEELKLTEVNLNKKVMDLHKQLDEEIEKRIYAEEAAARARSNINLPTSPKKCLEKKKTLPRESTSECSSTSSEKKENKDRKEEKDIEVVLVEYTRGKIYYAMKNGDLLTYCNKHVGIISDEQFMHRPQKLSFKINEKDQQTFENKFVILSMKGTIQDKVIKIDKLSSSVEEQMLAIKNYIKKNNVTSNCVSIPNLLNSGKAHNPLSPL